MDSFSELSISPIIIILFFLIPQQQRIQLLDEIKSQLESGSSIVVAQPLELFLQHQMIETIKHHLAKNIQHLNQLISLTPNQLTQQLNAEFGLTDE